MEKPRIQDDLYTYVNQEKLEELIIPDDQPCVGGFQTLAVDVEQTMINEFNIKKCYLKWLQYTIAYNQPLGSIFFGCVVL